MNNPLSAVLLLLAAAGLAPVWRVQESHASTSLRGLSVVNNRVIWASGAHGTVLRTIDGGRIWSALHVPAAEALDFRAVKAFSQNTAYLLSIGEGSKSRIYKTIDGGVTWRLQYTNADPNGFYDAIAFWDAAHGIVLGDPVNGRFEILSTADGGAHWKTESGPAANTSEGAFAASGTCLLTLGQRDAWVVTGDVQGARVLHSSDRGATWTSVQTSIRHDGKGAGIFSIAFAGDQHGIVVGGDYLHPNDATHNVALTSDGGRTWREPSGVHPTGYRSAVAYVAPAQAWIAVGTSGADVSNDNGETWQTLGGEDFNAIGVADDAVYAVGVKGRIASIATSALHFAHPR